MIYYICVIILPSDYTTRYITTVINLFFIPQLAGKARQLGCPKIVLDHVRVYIQYRTKVLGRLYFNHIFYYFHTTLEWSYLVKFYS